VEVLKDESLSVRKKVIWALGEIGDSRVIEYLAQALLCEYGYIQNEAVEALEELGWKPRNDIEKAHYLTVKEQWDEVTREMDEFEKKILEHIDKIKIDAPRQWGWRFSLYDTLRGGDFWEEPDAESFLDVVIFWSKEENEKVLKKVNEEIFNDVDYNWEDMAVFANPQPTLPRTRTNERKLDENQRIYSYLFDNMQSVFTEIRDWLLENGIGKVVGINGSPYTEEKMYRVKVRYGIVLIQREAKGLTWKEENLYPTQSSVMKTPDFWNWFKNQERYIIADEFEGVGELEESWDVFKNQFVEYWHELRAKPRKILEKFPYFKDEIHPTLVSNPI
ncbi:MAG: HEAT repeat domain-containing protein, partial [Candidatus Hodarchaeota archaeon]